MLEKSIISGFADEIDDSLEVQIEVLKRLGQNYIVFRTADKVGVAAHSLEEAKRVKERLDKSGIKISSLGSPIGKIDITEQFQPHYELFKHVVALAKVLDTRYIRIFSFFMPEGENPSLYEKEVFSRLEQMIAYAKKEDVVLLHENEKDIYGDTIERCEKLMKRFYCDHFKAIFDFANFVECQQDTMDAYERLKQYIEYIHVKDAIASEHRIVLPGTGDGRLEEIFKLLDQNSYQGFISLEPHLVNFSALTSLEKNVAARTMTDGIAAYTMAHEALVNMLGRVKD